MLNRLTRVTLLVSMPLFIVQPAHAASPALRAATPAAVIPGETNRIEFSGDALEGALQFWSSFPAQIGFRADTQNPDTAIAELGIPPETPVSIGAVRLATKNGVSDLLLMMIDDLPGIEAGSGNHSPTTARRLDLPGAIDGACRPLKMNYYKFTLAEAAEVSVEVVAQRLGSKLDPVIRLLDGKGREFLHMDDEPTTGRDCRFRHKFTEPGEYYLEVRDVLYQGGAEHRYRLRVGDFPLISYPFPPAIEAGSTQTVAFLGPAVEGLKAKSVSAPAEVDLMSLSAPFEDGAGSGFATLRISNLRELQESEPNDKPTNANRIELPGAVSGRFAIEREVDYFEFEAKKGQRWVFRGQTRSLGSPCDLFMRLERADGGTLAEADVAGANEGTLEQTFAADGIYRLRVEELSQQSGALLIYRIEATRFEPGFDLSIETDKVEATPGGQFSLKVTCARREFDGPIELSVVGAEGLISSDKSVIPEKKTEATLKAKVSPEAEPGRMLHFKVAGRAQANEQSFESVASTRPALRKAFPSMRNLPEQLDGWVCLGIRAKQD